MSQEKERRVAQNGVVLFHMAGTQKELIAALKLHGKLAMVKYIEHEDRKEPRYSWVEGA